MATTCRKSPTKSIVTVREDKEYNLDYFKEGRDCVVKLVNDHREKLSNWIKQAYGVVNFEEVGIRPPGISNDEVVFYGFAGCYDCGDFILEVEPKVGWDAYFKMLGEAVEAFKDLPTYPHKGTWIGELLKALTLGKVKTVEYSDAVLHLAQKLTQFLKPQTVETYYIVSEGEVGKVHHHKTLTLLNRGVPMGVFQRSRAVDNTLPLSMLAKLNREVLDDLKMLNSQLRAKALSNEIETLIKKHEELARRLSKYERECCAKEQIEKILDMSRGNPPLRALAHLYLSYQKDRALIKRLSQDGILNSISTHKLYELWILAYLYKYLKEKYQAHNTNAERLDLIHGGELKLYSPSGEITIEYNTTKKFAPISVRPDYIIHLPHKTVPIDAKYKSTEEDWQKILVYATLLSDTNSPPLRIVAGLMYLNESKTMSIPKKQMEIKLYSCRAVPDNIDDTCLDQIIT